MAVFVRVVYGSVKSCSISISFSLKVHRLTNLINYSSFWPSPSSQWLDSIPANGCTVLIWQEPVPVPAKPFASTVNGRNLYGRTRAGTVASGPGPNYQE